MGHGVTLLFQFLLFSFCEVGVAELIILELQEVDVLTVMLYVFFKCLELVFGILVGCIGLLVVGQLLTVVGDDVSHTELEVLFVEQQVLVLRVYIDEPVAEFLQHRELHGGVVDEGAALAGGRQFTPDDTFLCIVVDVVFLEESLHAVA